MTLEIFPRNNDVLAPRKSNPLAAGYDLFFSKNATLACGLTKIDMEFGLKLPSGYSAILKTRSSAASKHLSVEAGVIDESFSPHANLFALIRNHDNRAISVKRGESAIQMILIPRPEIALLVVGPNDQKIKEVKASNHLGLGSTGNAI